MLDEIDEYLYLKKRIKKDHSALYFFRFCELHRKIYGNTHTLCYYKSLLVSIRLGEKLTYIEKEYFTKLYKKYGEMNIEHILACAPDNSHNEKSFTVELKSVLNDIIEDTKEENQCLAELTLLIRNNLDFSYNNPNNNPCYDAESMNQMFNIIEKRKELCFSLSELLSIRLLPKTLLHIITGHLPKYKIPRKGLLADFINISEWFEIVILIEQILYQEKDNIIDSYTKNKTFNNKNILFNGYHYGLHIQKNKCINSFYPIPSYNA